MLLKPGSLEGVGLDLDIGLGEKAAVDRLLAEGTPTKVGLVAGAVDLGRILETGIDATAIDR